MCLFFFVLTLNCFGAKERYEDSFEQGKQIYLKKDINQTIENYTKAIKRNHKLVKAYNNRGIAYVGNQQYDLAVADFNKVIEWDPKNGKTYHNRAIAYWS
jgi:tetratricopeptide (TPR) repeat protein